MNVIPLFAGVLSDEETDVYVVPPGKEAGALIIRMVNVSNDQVLVNVSLDLGDGHIKQFPSNYPIGGHAIAGDFNWKVFLSAGHKIVIEASAAAAIHCYIGGFERDA